MKNVYGIAAKVQEETEKEFKEKLFKCEWYFTKIQAQVDKLFFFDKCVMADCVKICCALSNIMIEKGYCDEYFEWAKKQEEQEDV